MSFAELKTLINDSQSNTTLPNIELTYILSPMRTLSTVLLPALLQFTDGIMSEPMHPFNRDPKDPEGGFKSIHRYISQRIKQNTTAKKLRIVCKDMSHIVKPEDFEKLSQITTNFLFTVREPRMQIKSAIQAFHHDLNLADFNGDENLRMTQAEDLSIKYNTPAYKNLASYLEQASSIAPNNTLVVSSLATKLDPVGILTAIANQFKWPYETVTNKWIPLIDRYDIIHPKRPEPEWREYISNHFWVKAAFKANRIMNFDPERDAEIPLSHFSDNIQHFLLNVADPTYRRMLADSNALLFPVYRPENMALIEASNPYLADCMGLNTPNSTQPGKEHGS